MGHRYAGEVAGIDAELAQSGQEHPDRALAPRLDEDRPRSFDQVPSGELLPAPEQRVDLDNAWCEDGSGHATTLGLGTTRPRDWRSSGQMSTRGPSIC